ncbi:hypothetical protein [Streptomyces sp. RKAG293]|uniref:hypothetical protein n=1 Tax=Streptomyces sp. RKAG293 TaxID=2893403 RepID=UPI0020337C0F|nr:hypothetical protein [Streptomyces sp. RKAG293]MCM2416611.1 hypothetical protein [Streptomyces sp. RKAG293]
MASLALALALSLGTGPALGATSTHAATPAPAATTARTAAAAPHSAPFTDSVRTSGIRPATSPGVGPRKALFMVVNWAGNSSLSAARGGDVGLLASGVAAQKAWYQAASEGRFQGWDVTALPMVINIATPPAPTDSTTQAGCNSLTNAVPAAANNTAKGLGQSITGYDTIVYWFPHVTSCGNGGITIGNTIVFNGRLDQDIVVHEFGHRLGLGHSHSAVCVDPQGKHVALSTDCTTDEYGNVLAAMGNGQPGIFTPDQMAQLGWDGPPQTVTQPSGTYRIQTAETNNFGLPHALRLQEGNQTLWVEYRQPTGVDTGQGLENGVVLYREDPATHDLSLIDTHTLFPDFFDSPMNVHESWEDPVGHWDISFDAGDSSSATVIIHPSGVELAVYQAANHHLSTLSHSGVTFETMSTMEPGTTGSIARLSTGGYKIAFAAADDTLWVQDDRIPGGTGTPTGHKLWPGTSPSIAADSAGGWMVTFQDDTSRLWTLDSAGHAIKTNSAMNTGTDPSIAHLSTGGYEIAFVGSDGKLYSQDAGIPGGTSHPIGHIPASSPAIAADANGGWKIAFEGNTTNHLITYDSHGVTNDTTAKMWPSTSPAITALPTGGYETAINAWDGNLAEVGDGGNRNAAGGVQVAHGTSPAIADLSTTGFTIAYTAPDNRLTTVSPDNTAHATNSVPSDGTSPNGNL